MARNCTCQICKSKGTTDKFYKVTEKGKNKYYCNKEEYDQFINEKKKRDDLRKYIAIEILNYQEGQIVPPVLIKKVNKLNEFYDCEVIKECFHQQKENVQYWMSAKKDLPEYNLACYIMKIIESNINDVYEKWKYKQKQLQKQESANLDLGIINEIETVKPVKKNDSILNFLDEEDV